MWHRPRGGDGSAGQRIATTRVAPHGSGTGNVLATFTAERWEPQRCTHPRSPRSDAPLSRFAANRALLKKSRTDLGIAAGGVHTKSSVLMTADVQAVNSVFQFPDEDTTVLFNLPHQVAAFHAS